MASYDAKAERTNRTVSEGTRACLIQRALGEEWWTLELLWIAMHNGVVRGQDGCSPYWRRYGVNVEYKQYPFGALVLLHPAQPVVQVKEPKHNK